MRIRQFFKSDEWRKAALGFKAIAAIAMVFIILLTLSTVIDIRVITAFATILLAMVAVSAIWNTSNIYRHTKEEQLEEEQRDTNERLLNEIIQWGVDVGKCGADIDFVLLAAKLDNQPWGGLSISGVHNDLRQLRQKSKYVTRIAHRFPKLDDEAKKLIGELNKYVKACDDLYIQLQSGARGSLEMIMEPLYEYDSLATSAGKLIERATDIKLTLLPL